MGDVNLEIKLSNLDERVIKIEESGGGGTSTGDMLKSEFVLSGGTGQVLSAKEADHATNADNATTATDATYAKNLKKSDGTTISAYSIIEKLPKVDDNSNNIKGIIGGDEYVPAETYGTNDGLKNVCIHNNKIYSAKKESFTNIEPTAASGWNYYWEETSISALNSKLKENIKFIQVPIAGTQFIGTSGKYYATVDFTDSVPEGYFPISIFENGAWDECSTYMLNINETTMESIINIRSNIGGSIPSNKSPLNIVCIKIL